tara:strand:- start:240 stop:941 length:702 start_codon:yes stop_codon:yes gene_type:complete
MNSKRIIDIFVSLMGLFVFSPILLIITFFVYIRDFKSPLYKAERVGKEGNIFTMIKLRSMIHNADSISVESTANDDRRITGIGKIIRRYKLDEISQLWNVLIGDMSLVGPRPNTQNGVKTYSEYENKLLSVKPGITDFSSIIFSDEGAILEGSDDPDRDYDLLIRPWKSRFGVFYIMNSSLLLDLKIILITVVSIFSRKYGLLAISKLLIILNADENLVIISQRKRKLSDEIV